MSVEELVNFLIEQTEHDLRLIYRFGLEVKCADEKQMAFIRGRVRGYCSGIFALLLELRKGQQQDEISEAIHQIIQLRDHAEKMIAR